MSYMWFGLALIPLLGLIAFLHWNEWRSARKDRDMAQESFAEWLETNGLDLLPWQRDILAKSVEAQRTGKRFVMMPGKRRRSRNHSDDQVISNDGRGCGGAIHVFDGESGALCRCGRIRGFMSAMETLQDKAEFLYAYAITRSHDGHDGTEQDCPFDPCKTIRGHEPARTPSSAAEER